VEALSFKRWNPGYSHKKISEPAKLATDVHPFIRLRGIIKCEWPASRAIDARQKGFAAPPNGALIHPYILKEIADEFG
jgi:hypothetical protein